MDLNDCLTNHKQYYKKRQSIYLDCLFLCLVFILFKLLFLSRISYAQPKTDCKKLAITETVQLQKVYDGDTILLKDGRKIRLIGINAPEFGRKGQPSQPYAKKAKAQLKTILTAYHNLTLAYDLVKKDKYNRTLAYVYLPDGSDVQAQMLSSGLATSIVIMPNENNLNCYRKLEEKARKQQQGIWQQVVYQEIAAKNLNNKSKIYGFVKGKVTSIKIKSQMMIVLLDNHLSIKLSGKAFQVYKEKQLMGQNIHIRGILYSYRKKPAMSIYHPLNVKIDI